MSSMGKQVAMAVQVVHGSVMSADRTSHHARSVGDESWAVSYLPGRTLSTEQAVVAMQIAEVASDLERLTPILGLTPLEAIGHVLWPLFFRNATQ